MLKSSEFNSAVPKFTNGNYASTPLDPTNVEEPSAQDYVRGAEPLDTLPAQWWNWLCNQFTSRFNKLNTYVKNIFDELTGFLSLLNITPDGTESAITTGQLKNAFKEDYPAYINSKLALGTTYVKKTQKVNNHALTGDITLTKSDVGLGNVPNVTTNNQTPTYTVASSLANLTSGEVLSTAFGKLAKAVSSLISHINNTSNPHSVTKAQVGLGNVANTSDSDTPTENGTAKFTNGGAYTLKKDLTDIASSLPTDAVLHYSFDEVSFYPDGTADYYRNQDFTLQDGWGGGNNVVTVPNGILTINNVVTAYVFKPISITNPIVRCKIRTSISDTILLYCNSSGNQYTIASVNTRANEVTEITGFVNKTITSVGFTGFDMGTRFEILSFYIGDGSYSTPIIDNANGQWNSISQKGISVQGISGKGLLGVGRNHIATSTFPKPTDKSSITLSIWVKYTNKYNDTGTRNLFGIGAYNGAFCIFQYYVINSDTMRLTSFVRKDSSHQRVISADVTRNEWHNAVMVWENKTLTFYVDGNKYVASALDIQDFTFGGSFWRIGDTGVVQGEEPSTIGNIEYYVDDAQIFDRALTETEVTALYLNKANTPKYYGEVPVTRKINGYTLEEDITLTKADVGLGNVANKDLSNVVNTGDSATPVENGTTKFTTGGAYTELAKKVDKTTTVNGHALSSDVTVTKSDVGLGDVANKDLSNVVNTGDSNSPILNGTDKFTTGGAYNLLLNLAPAFSTSTAYAVNQLVTYNGTLYKCTTAHSAGAWNNSHFTAVTLNDVAGVTGVKGNSETEYRKGDVNITKNNVGLSNVVNTGDSATPVENGTTKFTTGGAYTELNKKFDKLSAGDQVTYSLSGNTLTITSLA